MDPNQNPVPPGATPKEVADDVDIKASEGEYILPANVVRFLGLDKIEKMVQKANEQLESLSQKGRIGGDTGEDELPFTAEELQALEEEMPQEPVPQMAAGGLVTNPNSDLPEWMKNQPFSVPTAPAAPAPPSMFNNEERKGGEGERQGPPVGLAGSVDQWTPENFEKYSVARNSPEQKFGQYLASTMPFGSAMAKFRERYLERTVPKELKNMIEKKTDLQGNPLAPDQIERLQASYDQMTTTPLDGFGRAGLARQMAEKAGIISPRSEPKTTKREESYEKDGFLNKVIDAVTKSPQDKKDKKEDDSKSDRSKDEKTPTSRSSSKSSSNKR